MCVSVRRAARVYVGATHKYSRRGRNVYLRFFELTMILYISQARSQARDTTIKRIKEEPRGVERSLRNIL